MGVGNFLQRFFLCGEAYAYIGVIRWDDVL